MQCLFKLTSYETFEGPLVFSVLMLILWWAAAAIKMQMFAMFANLDSREKEVVDNGEERRPYLLTTQAFSWPVESINKICKTLISFDLVPFFLEYLVNCRCVDIYVVRKGKESVSVVFCLVMFSDWSIRMMDATISDGSYSLFSILPPHHLTSASTKQRRGTKPLGQG